MKKNISFLLIICAIFLIDFNGYSQCNLLLAGSYDQVDSCTNYPHSQSRTVLVTASGPDQIIISNFGSFLQPNDVFVTVDCTNNTMTIFQTLGTTNITGSGTFASDYSSMILNFNVDFGTSSINCTDVYTRLPDGITDIGKGISVSVSPNPVDGLMNVRIGEMINDTKVLLLNSIGQIMYETTIKAGQQVLPIDMAQFPAGSYNLKFSNGLGVTHRAVVKM